MTERSSYVPGTPSWVDLSTGDMDGTTTFYGELFGWTTAESGPADQTGGYRMFQQHGRNIAGVAPTMAEGQPPAWTTYVSVADAAETAEKIRAAGGQILMEPMAVMDAGTMAVFNDTVGAMIAIWQPGAHTGADLVNEPGALAWNELQCRDIEAAKKFYGAVFGWGAVTNPQGDTTYTEWQIDGNDVGGMLEMGASFPAEMPSYWLAYFAVEDADAALARAGELGGSVMMEAQSFPVGRIGVATDQQGAAFAVIALSGETP